MASVEEVEVIALVLVLLILLHLRLTLHLHHHLLLLHLLLLHLLHLHLLHSGWVGAPASVKLVTAERIATGLWLETTLRLETWLLLLLLVLFCNAEWVSPWYSVRLELVTTKLLLLHCWLLSLVLVCIELTKYINFTLRRSLISRNTTTRRKWLARGCTENVIQIFLRCLSRLLRSIEYIK